MHEHWCLVRHALLEVAMLSRLAVTFLVVTGLTGATSAAQEVSTSPATVTSLGEAVIRRPPDRVVITFATEARGQSPQEALEEEALRIAVGVARARASALAAGAGLTVDRIVTITEERAAMSAAGPNAGIRYATQESVMVGGGSVPVASGEIEIRMRVLLTATLK